MKDLEQIIVNYLKSEGFSDVYEGTEKSGIDKPAIYVAQATGEEPDYFVGSTTETYNRSGVQVMVVSSPRDEKGSQVTAWNIYEDLRHAQPDGLTLIKPQQTPIRLGADSDDVYRWSINFNIEWIE